MTVVASTALAPPETFRIGRVLSESFATMGRNLPLCGLLVLIFDVVPTVGFRLWSWALIEHGVPKASSQAWILAIVHAVSNMGLAGMLQIAVAFMVMEDSRGREPKLRDCMAVAGKRMLSAAVVGLIANAVLNNSGLIYWRAIGSPFRLLGHIPLLLGDGILMAGVAVASIPGIVLWVRWFVAIPVIERERPGILKSLGRSRDLTKGSRWSLAMFWLATFGAVLPAFLISRYWVRPLGATSRVSFDELTVAADSFVTAVVMAVTYVELLRVKEGIAVEDVTRIFS
jgi:hypothetical protein